jgi:hypothetical protein
MDKQADTQASGSFQLGGPVWVGDPGKIEGVASICFKVGESVLAW